MASPAQVSIHNMAGNWQLNRELSDDLEGALTLQGMPWLVRKIMLSANVSEKLEETTRADGVKGLTATKSAAGLKGQADAFDGSGEEVVMDGGYFGPKVRVRSWWVDPSSEKAATCPAGKTLDPYLLNDWIEEEPKGTSALFAGSGENEKSGVSDNMMWGFSNIQGQRYRAVKYHIRKGDKQVRARLVFNWTGEK